MELKMTICLPLLYWFFFFFLPFLFCFPPLWMCNTKSLEFPFETKRRELHHKKTYKTETMSTDFHQEEEASAAYKALTFKVEFLSLSMSCSFSQLTWRMFNPYHVEGMSLSIRGHIHTRIVHQCRLRLETFSTSAQLPATCCGEAMLAEDAPYRLACV